MRKKSLDRQFWTNQLNTPKLNTWNGLAFERVCLLHVEQIKRALGITGILTSVCSFKCEENLAKGLRGSQIDLLILRRDRTINLLEIKFSDRSFVLTRKNYEDLLRKRDDLLIATNDQSAIHLTIVTPIGLVQNDYRKEIHSVVTVDQLFER